jgi:hypothetical protein
MNNRIFNINGRGQKMLADVLDLAMFHQHGCYEGNTQLTASGYKFSRDKGLILLWHADTPGTHKFIAPLGAEALATTIMEWLKTEEASSVKLGDWEMNLDHDGHNSLGWRVYCEDWGHVGGEHYAIAAVKPCYLWHGK